MKLLTNLIFEPKGKHDSTLAYTVKDTVMSADGTQVYFALQDVPVGIALDNEEYWKLQIDLSGSKKEVDQLVASFGDYAKVIGQRVKGEVAKASGDPVVFLPDGGCFLQPVSVFQPKQSGGGDPYPAGGSKNLFDKSKVINANVTDTGFSFINPESPNNPILIGAFSDVAPFAKVGDELVWHGEVVNGSYARPILYVGEDWLMGDAITVKETTLSSQVCVYGLQNVECFYNNVVIMKSDSADSSDYTPYSNIRPITGYDTLELAAAGKNLLPIIESKTMNGVTMTVDANGTITLNGTSTGDGFNYHVQGLDLPAGNYVLSLNNKTAIGSSGADTVYCAARDSAYSWIVEAYCVQSNAVGVGATGTGIVDFMLVVPPGVVLNNFKMAIQFEVGSAATTYEPYQSNTYTVQIGQTIYGGRFDWLTGKLTAEWTIYTLTGTEKLTVYPNRTFLWLDSSIPYAAGNKLGSGCCSHGIFYSTSSPDHGSFVAFAGISAATGRYLAFIGSHPVFDSVDTLKAYFAAQLAAGTPVQVAYKLAEPVELGFLNQHVIFAADPEQNNTMYGDGTIEVEYVKPLHVSIEERVAAALAAMATE